MIRKFMTIFKCHSKRSMILSFETLQIIPISVWMVIMWLLNPIKWTGKGPSLLKYLEGFKLKIKVTFSKSSNSICDQKRTGFRGYAEQ